MWNVARYPHQWDRRLMEVVFYHDFCPENIYYSYHYNEEKGQVSTCLNSWITYQLQYFSGLRTPLLKYIVLKSFIHYMSLVYYKLPLVIKLVLILLSNFWEVSSSVLPTGSSWKVVHCKQTMRKDHLIYLLQIICTVFAKDDNYCDADHCSDTTKSEYLSSFSL